MKTKSEILRKNVFSICLIAMATLVLVSCSKDDDNNQPNRAPEAFNMNAFNIIGGVGLTPTITWQAAVDPDGDTVTYELYLYLAGEASELFPGANNITTNSYMVDDSQALQPSSVYRCQVKAKDGKGGETLSNVLQFQTTN